MRILTAEPAAYNINRASDGQPIKAGEYVLEIDFGGNLATNALGMYQTPNQQEHGPGYRNIRVSNLVEDPYFKDSRDSYCVQAADLAAFLLDQKFAPSSYIKRKYAQNYFNRLQPVLCTVASSSNPDGIVHL